MSSEDSSASLFKRLWRPSGVTGYTGGIAGNGIGGTLPSASPRSIRTSSSTTVPTMSTSTSTSSNVPHSSAMAMTSTSKAHPLAPIKTQQHPGSPISHPEMCFSPTDVGIWEVERPKNSNSNFSGGSTGTGAGPRGFFSSILGGSGGGGSESK